MTSGESQNTTGSAIELLDKVEKRGVADLRDTHQKWWDSFWKRFEENTDMTHQQAYELWQRLKMNAGRWFDR